jgi:hypothetical protein
MTTLTQEFDTRVKALEKRAKAAGTNMTRICADTGLARATWERWSKRAPQIMRKFDELEKEIAKAERESAKATA